MSTEEGEFIHHTKPQQTSGYHVQGYLSTEKNNKQEVRNNGQESIVLTDWPRDYVH